MKAIRGTRTTPPRFVARTMIATFATVGFILAAVFVVVTVAVRATVRSTVAERLDTGQRILSALEQRRGRELQTRVATLAENPDAQGRDGHLPSGAAARAWRPEPRAPRHDRTPGQQPRHAHPPRHRRRSRIRRAPSWPCRARRRADWPADGVRQLLSTDASGQFVALPGAVFRFAAAPLVLQDGQNTVLGELQLATALDSDYAAELSLPVGRGHA